MKPLLFALLVFAFNLAPGQAIQEIPSKPVSTPDAGDLKFESLLRSGRYQEAIAQAKREVDALQASPSPALAVSLFHLGSALRACDFDLDARPLLEQALALQAGEEPLDEITLTRTRLELALVLIGIDAFPAAREHLQLAIALLEERKPSEDKLHADAISARGSLYLAQALFAQAQPDIERALAIRRRLEMPHDVGRSLVQLGSLFGDQQKRDQQKLLLDEAIATLEKALGSHHPALIAPLSQLAWSMLDRRETDAAQATVDRQLLLAEASCGPESPLAAAALMQSAYLHATNGSRIAANAEAQRAIRIEERAVGSNSPRFAIFLRIQGMILRQAGDLMGAEKALRQSIQLTSSPGSEILSAFSMNALASLLHLQGRVGEAREQFLRSQSALDQVSAGDIGLSLMNLQSLLALSQGGDSETIAPLLERTITASERINGPDCPCVAEMAMQLAQILLERRETWRAGVLAKKALSILEATKGLGSIDVAAPLKLVAMVEQATGDLDDAQGHLDRVLAIQSFWLGETNPQIAATKLDLAGVHFRQGDLASAGALYKSVSDLTATEFERDHPLKALALGGLALVAKRSGRLTQATQLLDRSIQSLEKSLGSKNAALAPLLAERAELYRTEGRLSAAEAMLIRSRDSLGQALPHVILQAQIDANRAAVAGEMGKTSEAETLFQRAIQTLEARAGMESLDLAQALQYYGGFLLKQRSLDEAEATFERAFQIFLRIFGSKHELVAFSLTRRGAVQEARGNFRSARESLEAALAILRNAAGAEHPQMSDTLMQIGQVAGRMGDWSAAEDAFRRALEIGQGTLEEHDSAMSQDLSNSSSLGAPNYEHMLAGPLHGLGQALGHLGRLQDSFAALGQARKLLEDAGLTDSPQFAAVLQSIAASLIEMGRYREARLPIERALAILRERHNPYAPEVAQALRLLASLLAREGDYGGSRRAVEEALESLAKSGVVAPEPRARLESDLADLLSQQGDYAKARQLKSASLATLRETLEPNHPDLGDLLRSNGDMLQSQGDIPTALEMYRAALLATEKTLGLEHPQAGIVLSRLGSALICKGDRVAARSTLERAKSILENSLGADHPYVGEVLAQLGTLSSMQGDLEPAKRNNSRALQILQPALGPQHPALVPIYSRLAIDELLLLQPKKSTDLLEKATSISNSLILEGGPSSVPLLCNVASAQHATGNDEAAKNSYKLALEVLRGLGKDSGIEAIGILMGIGSIELKAGRSTEARSSFLSAKRIAETALAPDSPQLGMIVGNLGILDWREGNRAAARKKLLRSADLLQMGTLALLPSISFAEQRAYLGTQIAYPVPYLLSFFGGHKTFHEAYDRMIPLKGILVEALRRENFVERNAESTSIRDPRIVILIDRLQKLSTEISDLKTANTVTQGEGIRQKIGELEREKERAERDLVALLPPESLRDPLHEVDVRQIRRLLGAREAIVDLYRYQDVATEEHLDQYAAVVFSQRRSPTLIHLGSAREIHAALHYWRNLVLAESGDVQPIETAWKTLRDRLWSPIASALPSEVRGVWLSPDGELARVPWQLFPLDGDSTSHCLITQIDSVREFVRLKGNRTRPKAGQPEALILGGIDYDNGAGELAATFEPLPATLEEARQITDLGIREGLAASLLQGADASKAEFLSPDNA